MASWLGSGIPQLAENLDHGGGGLGGFGAAVDLGAEGAFLGLAFVVEQQDFVDHWEEMVEGAALQGIGDGGGDEVGVGSRAANDDTEGDDGVGFALRLADGFHNDRDFKSAGHPVNVDPGIG